jgi:hypothetical protein
VDLVIVAWGAVSPRVLVRGKVIAVLGPRASEDASSVLEMVAASAGQPPRWLWVDLCWPGVLNELASPRG